MQFTLMSACLFAFFTPLMAQSAGRVQQEPKAQVMVLGVFHLVSTNNMFTQKQGDTLTPKRQREIEEVVERLRTFRPTKIAVEHCEKGKLNDNYRDYLQGKYVLTADETDQYAFRLRKELDLKQLECIYYPVSFDPGPTEAYARSHGQEKQWQAVLRQAQGLVERLNQVLERGTILDGLIFFNSDNAAIYLLQNRIGGGDQYPGADCVSAWYASNLHIFANLTRVISSTTDRVLVIYGQGHVELLRSFIEGSTDLQFVRPLSLSSGHVPEDSEVRQRARSSFPSVELFRQIQWYAFQVVLLIVFLVTLYKFLKWLL